MNIYFVGTFLSAILGYHYSIYRKKQHKSLKIRGVTGNTIKVNFDFIKFLPMLPLAIIAGIRYDVGQDYMYTYVPIFEQVISGNTKNTWGDIGYIFLNKIISLFTNDYAGIFIVTSCLFVFFTFKAIYYHSKNIVMSIILMVFMGYYFCFMNGVRQMLATSILIYSIKFIKERNIKKFAVCVFFASINHLTAVLFIPVYFLDKVKISNFKMIIILVVEYVSSGLLTRIILRFLLFTKYAWYLNSNYTARREGIILILMNFLILGLSMFYNCDRENDIFIKIQWIAVMMTSFIGLLPVANRIVWIFGLPSIILVPNIVACQKSKITKFVLNYIIIILYIIYFIYTVGINNSNSVLPYQTIFSR